MTVFEALCFSRQLFRLCSKNLTNLYEWDFCNRHGKRNVSFCTSLSQKIGSHSRNINTIISNKENRVFLADFHQPRFRVGSLRLIHSTSLFFPEISLNLPLGNAALVDLFG